jgi:hypothetical protein
MIYSIFLKPTVLLEQNYSIKEIIEYDIEQLKKKRG